MSDSNAVITKTGPISIILPLGAEVRFTTAPATVTYDWRDKTFIVQTANQRRRTGGA